MDDNSHIIGAVTQRFSRENLLRWKHVFCLKSCVLVPVKIGRISTIFHSKARVPSNKNQIFQKFLTYFPKSSYSIHESRIEDFFRIKSAGSSNYRGSVFLLPEFTRVYPRVYLHGSSAGECVLTCFSAGGCFFRLRLKAASYLRAYKAPAGPNPCMP